MQSSGTNTLPEGGCYWAATGLLPGCYGLLPGCYWPATGLLRAATGLLLGCYWWSIGLSSGWKVDWPEIWKALLEGSEWETGG